MLVTYNCFLSFTVLDYMTRVIEHLLYPLKLMLSGGSMILQKGANLNPQIYLHTHKKICKNMHHNNFS